MPNNIQEIMVRLRPYGFDLEEVEYVKYRIEKIKSGGLAFDLDKELHLTNIFYNRYDLRLIKSWVKDPQKREKFLCSHDAWMFDIKFISSLFAYLLDNKKIDLNTTRNNLTLKLFNKKSSDERLEFIKDLIF